MPEKDLENSFINLLASLWQHKWLIVAITLTSAVLSLVYALKQQDKYTATTTLLSISGTSSSLSQYSGFASLAGIGLPGANSSDPTVQIQVIMKSRTFTEKLIEDMNLIPLLFAQSDKMKSSNQMQLAIMEIQNNILSLSYDAKTAVMKISAETKDPLLSRDIANRAVDLLQEDLKARTLSASGKNITLIEQQMADQEQKVKIVKNKLIAYQRKNKFVSPQAQSASQLQFYQNLIQQKITLEMEITRLENTFSSENYKIVAAKSQLDAVKKQISDLEKTGGEVGPSISETPSVLMEINALNAELELAMKIYSGLLSSLENLRLQSASEKLFIEVIDRAVAPENKSKSSRSRICIVGTLAGGLLSIFLIIIIDAISPIAADPKIRAKFSRRKKPSSMHN